MTNKSMLDRSNAFGTTARRRRSVHRQQGMSFGGWLVGLVIASAVITIGLRTVPHYIEHRAIKSVLQSIDSNTARSKPKSEVHALIDKRLKINNIRAYKSGDIVTIKRTKNKASLLLDYEVREHVVANADVVLVFQNEYNL